MKIENDLGKDNIHSLVWRIAIPSMLAQFVSVLYSIVDRMYIGNIPEIGDMALAGVGICGPVVTMVGSIASLVGVGGAPLVGISMGEGNLRYAKKILSNCFLLIWVFSALIMATVLPLRGVILPAFGASETTYSYAEQYFFIYLLGTPFALMATGLNQFVICQGYAKAGMKSVVLGAVTNIILDPIFIFGLNMGVRGGALATVISQCASCAYVLGMLCGKKLPVHLQFGGYSLRIIRQVLTFGFSPFIIIAMDNVMIIAMNAMLQRFGGPGQGDMLVTCATIAQSFMLIVTMPLSGISGGTQGLLSFNYGACQSDRVRSACKFITKLCMGYTAVLFVLSWLAGPLFVRLFTQSPDLAAEAVRAIRICTLFIIPLGAQYEFVDALTAMGQVRLSLPLSFGRKLIYFVALFALPVAFGARAIFYAEPISDLLMPIISFLVFRRNLGPILYRREHMADASSSADTAQ